MALELFTLVGKVSLDSGEFMAGVQDAIKEAGSLQNVLGKLANTVTTGINKMTNYGDAVDKGSKRLGLSAKTYQELNYALGMSGASIDELTRGVSNLNSVIAGNAGKNIMDAFEALGFSQSDLSAMKTADEQLGAILGKLASLDNTSTRKNIADTIFGKGAGANLEAFFSEGTDGIERLRQEANDLGIVLSDESIQQAVTAKDSMEKVQQSLDALLMNGITPLLPVITSLVDAVAPVIGDISSALTQLLSPVLKLAGIDPEKKALQERIDAENAANAEKAKNGELAYQDLVSLLTSEKGQYIEFAKVLSRLQLDYGADESQAREIANNIYGLKYHETTSGMKKTFAGGDEVAEDKVKADLANLISTNATAMETAAQLAEQNAQTLETASQLADQNTQTLETVSQFDDQNKQATETISDLSDQAATANDNLDAFGAGMLDSMDNIEGGAGDAASALNNIVSAASNAASAMNSIPHYSGEPHAKGAWDIPYDNYPALLHRNEMVLTASQARQYREGGGGSFDMHSLASGIIAAVKEGMKNAQVNAYMDGKEVTDNVSRRMANEFKAMRYAT